RARPGDRSAVDRTDHHRQATRSTGRVRSVAPKRPLALPTRTALSRGYISPTRALQSSGAVAEFEPAPDDTPSTRKDTNRDDHHPTRPDDATGLHPTAPGTRRVALAAKHRKSRQFSGFRRG